MRLDQQRILFYQNDMMAQPESIKPDLVPEWSCSADPKVLVTRLWSTQASCSIAVRVYYTHREKRGPHQTT
jgi:hypothetical protein